MEKNILKTLKSCILLVLLRAIDRLDPLALPLLMYEYN